MAMSLLKDIESRQQRKDLPKFSVGDTVRVFSRIKEGEKERVQYFEGIVIGFHRNAVSTTFKVRKESYGVGVERTYPIHSPLLEKIEVKKRGDVRRAKLFYLREKVGRHARIRERRQPVGGPEMTLLRAEPEVVVPDDIEPDELPEVADDTDDAAGDTTAVTSAEDESEVPAGVAGPGSEAESDGGA